MKYIIGLGLGLVTGIFLYIFWKKVFGKYLPQEDAFLLKLICSVAYYIAGMINGGLFPTGNIYVMGIGFFLLFVVVAISYGFGIYYKVIASKNINV